MVRDYTQQAFQPKSPKEDRSSPVEKAGHTTPENDQASSPKEATVKLNLNEYIPANEEEMIASDIDNSHIDQIDAFEEKEQPSETSFLEISTSNPYSSRNLAIAPKESRISSQKVARNIDGYAIEQVRLYNTTNCDTFADSCIGYSQTYSICT